MHLILTIIWSSWPFFQLKCQKLELPLGSGLVSRTKEAIWRHRLREYMIKSGLRKLGVEKLHSALLIMKINLTCIACRSVVNNLYLLVLFRQINTAKTKQKSNKQFYYTWRAVSRSLDRVQQQFRNSFRAKQAARNINITFFLFVFLNYAYNSNKVKQ